MIVISIEIIHMHGPFPNIKPYKTHAIAVDDRHTLYVEECGRPQGLPVLVLQDEPGAGCQPYHRQFFNPEHYRIILLDQRGSGRSTPHGDLTNNDTQAILDDISTIQKQLNISQWLIFGHHWGATIGLLYAQAHPIQMLGLILSNVFMGRQEDIDWIFHYGANHFYPEQWEHFHRGVRISERHDLLQAYYQRLTGDNDIAQMKAAKQWADWLDTLSGQALSTEDVSRASLSQARVEAHFYYHHCFIQDNDIMNNIPRLEETPSILLHGRQNILSPLDNAWKLKRQWGDAAITILPEVGHTLFAPAMTEAIINATHYFAEQYGASS